MEKEKNKVDFIIHCKSEMSDDEKRETLKSLENYKNIVIIFDENSLMEIHSIK